ncbi:MAG: serine/threonine-protein kinase [Deltaproteobacteria bacterium]|nr:serine/threonine-protein kinase [Deltaproteobacteria bacterium]
MAAPVSSAELELAPPAGDMPPCPQCGHVHLSPTNYCGGCGADLRGLGGDTDTLVGASLDVLIDGRYKIQAKLGEGGMGSVFRVEHVRMGKVCALKLLRPELVDGPRGKMVRDRFKQEARIVSRLVHHNTIQVFDFGQTRDGALYLVMEFIRGRPLSDILREAGRLPELRVASIGAQVLRSLAEAHEAEIIHRDIKPANVMLVDLRDRKDFVKVLDFGIAKLTARAKGDTGAGEIVGTPYYLSPEQARGDPLDGRSDLYSLGAMLFEMLTGQVPFTAETPLGVMTAHITRPVPKIREHEGGQGVSAEMAAILEKAMAKRPADRFTDADEMRAALEALVGRGLGTSQEIVALPVDPTESGSHLAARADFERFARRLVISRFLKAMAPAVLLAGGLGGAYAWWQQPAPPLSVEAEPNDDPRTANLLSPERVSDLPSLAARLASRQEGLRTVEGHLGKRISRTQGDADFYRLELPGPDPATLFASIEGLPNIDLVLELLGERRDAPGKLEVIARADRKGTHRGEALPAIEITPGTWMLQVRQVLVGDEDGKLPLPVENVSDDYQLKVALLPSGLTQEREPNDRPEEASPLPAGKPVMAMTGLGGSEDWWRLEAIPEGAELTLSAPEEADLEVVVPPAEGASKKQRRRPRARLQVRAGSTGTLQLPASPEAPLSLLVRTERCESASAAYALELTLPGQP